MPVPKTPLLTVDVIIELEGKEGSIVLIERKNPPPGWALPGGFVDVGESCEQAAVREAREETGLEVGLITLLGIYSDPQRDPRGHTASAVYVGKAAGQPVAADDAKNIGIFMQNELPTLAFDHPRIVADYYNYYLRGLAVPLV
jgi:8-oxo-dGTP diphosphatase